VAAHLEIDKDNASELEGLRMALPVGSGAHYGFLQQMDYFAPETFARSKAILARQSEARYPTANLSEGQKQRVAVARALMNSPELVLADEPTGNLDRASATQVMELLSEINREEGTTFLISTHDEKFAAACQRQIVVVDGIVTG
jgi:lipoprotein-releasing system ATP-binding protein